MVDCGNRLMGFIAQADLARHEDEEQVGEMVEDISQPYGTGGMKDQFAVDSAADWRDESDNGYESGHSSERSSVASSLAIGAILPRGGSRA